MDEQSARHHFQQSKVLFKQGRYQEALDVLSELNAYYANQKNVMYPAALCMEKLGRTEEAKMLCRQMIGSFGYQKAQDLLDRLEAAPEVALPAGVDMDVLGDDVSPHVPELMDAPSKKKYYLIGAVVVAAVLVIALPLIFGSRVESGPSLQMSTASDSETGGTVVLLVFLLFVVGAHIGSCYLLYRICLNAGSDPGILIWVPILNIFPLMDAAGMSYFWLLASLVPFIGGLLFSVVLGMGLCEACEKPAWLGILILVPGVNILLFVYLAFS